MSLGGGSGYWLEKCRPVIKSIIDANPALPDRELREVLDERYPFAVRTNGEWSAWASEVKRQLDARRRERRPIKHKTIKTSDGRRVRIVIDERQRRLF